MRLYPAAANAPLLVLAHGAGAGHDHPWMRRVAEGLPARGVSVATFNFPYKDKGRGAPDPGPVLEAAYQDVWREAIAAAPDATAYFAGGKSMGGRIASQAAARSLFSPPPGGLIFFGYPLHPPGKPAQRRDRHLPDVTAPMLFIGGTRDPFGSPEEIQDLVTSLGDSATLHLVDGGDHSLAVPKRQDPNGDALDRAMDVAAEWLRALTTRNGKGTK
jgi:predicted alpha/beta-hydrolase family hydrolase